MRQKSEMLKVPAKQVVNHQIVGIIRFPDMAALNNWYESDAYQGLILLRDEAAEFTIVKYEQA